ncbi:MAG: hypothetical protein WC154_02745 [Candidatus Izemoplasmatales bacterium]
MSRLNCTVSASNDNNICLYFMIKTFRIYNNYSLDEAIKYSRKKGLSLHVVLIEPYEENQRNLDFFNRLTEDLHEKLSIYAEKVVRIKRPIDFNKLLVNVNSFFIDKTYLRFDLNIYEDLKRNSYNSNINLFTVESNVFVPVVEASNKEEYSARTIRNKISSRLDDYKSEVLTKEDFTIAEKKAFDVLEDFVSNKLEKYDLHNDPSLDLTSLLSPYLKYGFISPVTIYNKIIDIDSENKESFLEELIVRRELAYNFVYFNSRYDNFSYMTYDWAYNTMSRHKMDKREYIYTKEDYINFRTHDPYFNAAMKEMVLLGRMHSYMRMYWCKKIIEWSESYEKAFEIALELNNYFFLDGLTPNGYCGVAWCFGKHDRAWTERAIFGKLRYMNDNGLKRKFDIDKYVEKMNNI